MKIKKVRPEDLNSDAQDNGVHSTSNAAFARETNIKNHILLGNSLSLAGLWVKHVRQKKRIPF